MFFIKKLILNHKNNVIARNSKCDSLISQIVGALKSLDALFEDDNTYIDPSIVGEWFSRYSHLQNSKLTDDADLRKAKNYKAFVERQNELRRFSNSLYYLISEHNNVIARNSKCDSLISQIDGALKSFDALFEDENTYIDPSKVEEWFSRYSHLQSSKLTDDADLRKAKNYKAFVDRQNELRRFSNSLYYLISEHNDKVAEAKLREAYLLIGGVDGKNSTASR